jgi:hypothetical protein
LTELLPVTFPIELSACFSIVAAVLLANKSGKLVPKATKVIDTTSGFNPIRQPKIPAKSPIIAVNIPINIKATRKHNHPPHILAGGTMAKIT